MPLGLALAQGLAGLQLLVQLLPEPVARHAVAGQLEAAGLLGDLRGSVLPGGK
ncbi:hypothetical protein D3C78_1915940 [compost metagenome]